MKLTNIKSKKSKSGMTLIELTVVILVLLSLISVLFVGARAWMRGSDRANAALLIRNAQQGCRAQCNIAGVLTPARGSSAEPYVAITDETLAGSVFGSGRFVETGEADGIVPGHPVSGVTFGFTADAGESNPPLETMYITSSQEPDFYKPKGVQ